MPTKKIADLLRPCRHMDHDPPRNIVLDDGIYEHSCPGCGEVQAFEVNRPKMMLDARLVARAIELWSPGAQRRFAGVNRLGRSQAAERLVDELRGVATPSPIPLP